MIDFIKLENDYKKCLENSRKNSINSSIYFIKAKYYIDIVNIKRENKKCKDKYLKESSVNYLFNNILKKHIKKHWKNLKILTIFPRKNEEDIKFFLEIF